MTQWMSVEALVLDEMAKERRRRFLGRLGAATLLLGMGLTVMWSHAGRWPSDFDVLRDGIRLVVFAGAIVALLLGVNVQRSAIFVLAGSLALSGVDVRSLGNGSVLGASCGVSELLVAGLSAVCLFFALWRNRDPLSADRIIALSLFAALVAVGVQAVETTTCPARQELVHVLVYHHAPVALAALWVFAMGRWGRKRQLLPRD